MSIPTYRIRDWKSLYENGDTRKIKSGLRWVPTPTRHDGAGFRRLMKRPDGLLLFGAWNLILQVAAKAPERGTLSDGHAPWTSEDIADKTGAPADDIECALQVLSDPTERISWLEIASVHPETSGDARTDPDAPGEPRISPRGPRMRPATDRQVLHTGTTDKERSASDLFSSESTDSEPTPSKPPSRKQPKPNAEPEQIPASLNTPEFLAAWNSWKQHRRELKKPLTPTATQQQMAKLTEWGPAQAIIALNNSIASGWTSLNLPSAPSKPPPVAAPPPKPRQPAQEPAWVRAPDDPEKRARNGERLLAGLRKAAAEAALGREVQNV